MMSALTLVLGGAKCQALKDHIYDMIIDHDVFVYNNDDSFGGTIQTGDEHATGQIDINWTQRGSSTQLAYTLIHESSRSLHNDDPNKRENPRAKQDGIDCVLGAAAIFAGG
jgi:hypothetical protein